MIGFRCAWCRKRHKARATLVRSGKPRFCSVQCSSKERHQRLSVEVRCSLCGQKKRVRKSKFKEGRLFFCNNSHKASFYFQNGHPNRKTGASWYRQRALRVHGAKCSKCGYSKNPRMIDVDHISGNREDNTDGNLQPLCVWCHTFKTRKVSPHRWNGKFHAPP